MITSWDKLHNFVEKADRVLVLSHQHPDGDAISSTLIVGRILSLLGKQVIMANHSVVPKRFHYLDGATDILLPEVIQDLFQYVITVDCGNLERVGDCCSLFSQSVQIVNIDHHKTNDFFGSINYVNPNMAATVQLLYEWIHFLNIKLDLPLAKMIYTGLLTDTGGFRFSNTSPKVLKIASELVEIGVDPYQIADFALDSMTPEYVTILKTALSSLRISKSGQIASVVLSYEDLRDFTDIDLDGIVHYTRNIIGVEVGVFFREVDKDKVKISFRSKNFFDVASFAQKYGGGGHEKAAGCIINGSLQEIPHLILKHLEEKLEKTII